MRVTNFYGSTFFFFTPKEYSTFPEKVLMQLPLYNKTKVKQYTYDKKTFGCFPANVYILYDTYTRWVLTLHILRRSATVYRI